MFQCVLIASHPVTGHHLDEPRSVLFASSIQVFKDINKFTSTFQTVPALSISPHRRDAPVT